MEGTLQLKETAGGWRHYILLDNGRHYDLHCGNSLEVQLGEWVSSGESEYFQAKNWMQGRYEVKLISDKPKAHLYIGYAAPAGQSVYIVLPIGVKARHPQRY